MNRQAMFKSLSAIVAIYSLNNGVNTGLELSHCEPQIRMSFQKFAVKIVALLG